MKNKIKTFEDACKALNISTALPIVNTVNTIPEEMQKAVHSHYKLMVITKALNEGWEPNWNDSNEWKYYPWFSMGGSRGFSYYGCDGLSGSYVGARLCFKSHELAEYAGAQFKELYKEYFTLN